MKQIILTSNTEILKGNVYSIEAGKNDGQRHFDHHGEFENEKSPCFKHWV